MYWCQMAPTAGLYQGQRSELVVHAKGENTRGCTCQMVNEHVLTTVKSRAFARRSSVKRRMA